MYMLYHISLSVSRYTSLLLRPSLSPSLPLFLFLCCLFFFHSFFPSLHLSLSLNAICTCRSGLYGYIYMNI